MDADRLFLITAISLKNNALNLVKWLDLAGGLHIVLQLSAVLKGKFCDLVHIAETIDHVKPGGEILALVKPQFEAGKDRVGRKGVVSDPAIHGSVVGEVCLWVIEQPRLRLLGVRRSVLVGDKGNREFFVRMEVVG